jgi:hypothetical protein
MKQIFSLLLAAAVGSASTYYLTVMRPGAADKSAAVAPAGDKEAPGKSPKLAVVANPSEETPRKSTNSKFGGRTGGNFLPEEIDGVTPEQLNKCKAAFFKSFQDEGVKAARAKQMELRKEAEYASDDEKKNMRAKFEDAALDLRKATKAALLAADNDLTEDAVDKVLDAAEERMKQRLQQFQQNAKKK